MSQPYNDPSPYTCTFCEQVTPEDCMKTIEYTPDGSFTTEIKVCYACAWEAITEDPDHCKLVVPAQRKSDEA